MLEISRDRCVAQINDYTRWAPVWAQVLRWFTEVAPILNGAHPVTAIGIEYVDVFHWRGNPADLEISKVFERGGPYLPPNVFDLKTLWHSHHGYLEDCCDPLTGKILENINLNLIDELGQRSIAITTLHKAVLNTPLYEAQKLLDVLDPFAAKLHARNKNALSKLLTKEVAELIKLTGEST